MRFLVDDVFDLLGTGYVILGIILIFRGMLSKLTRFDFAGGD